MKFLKGVLVGAAVISLAACSGLEGRGNKELGGALVGAAVGGLVGSQIGGGTGQMVAVGAGVLLGALLGSEVGRSLDKADEAYAGQLYQNTLEATPTGETTTWVNPDSGNSGSYTPTKTYQADSGQYCREFQQTITVGGQTEDAYGTACREPDGSWRIVGN
ncbi:MAG: RT0821/Lpp0805 family surface protein [Alphaproteobacteria bacterium]